MLCKHAEQTHPPKWACFLPESWHRSQGYCWLQSLGFFLKMLQSFQGCLKGLNFNSAGILLLRHHASLFLAGSSISLSQFKCLKDCRKPRHHFWQTDRLAGLRQGQAASPHLFAFLLLELWGEHSPFREMRLAGTSGGREGGESRKGKLRQVCHECDSLTVFSAKQRACWEAHRSLVTP